MSVTGRRGAIFLNKDFFLKVPTLTEGEIVVFLTCSVEGLETIER